LKTTTNVSISRHTLPSLDSTAFVCCASKFSSPAFEYPYAAWKHVEIRTGSLAMACRNDANALYVSSDLSWKVDRAQGKLHSHRQAGFAPRSWRICCLDFDIHHDLSPVRGGDDVQPNLEKKYLIRHPPSSLEHTHDTIFATCGTPFVTIHCRSSYARPRVLLLCRHIWKDSTPVNARFSTRPLSALSKGVPCQ
jgi:hypothetical protein